MIVVYAIGWLFQLWSIFVQVLLSNNATSTATTTSTGSEYHHQQNNRILAQHDALRKHVAPPACFSGDTEVIVRVADEDTRNKEQIVAMSELRIGDYVRTSRLIPSTGEKDSNSIISNIEYSRVYGFGHYSNEDSEREYEFLQLYTTPSSAGNNKPLEISRSHLIYIVRKENRHRKEGEQENAMDNEKAVCTATAANVCEITVGSVHAAKPIPAETVLVGDLMVQQDGITLIAVTEIASVTRIGGAFAPLTESGTLFVNGKLASSYYLLQNINVADTTNDDIVPSFETAHWWSHIATAPRRWICHWHWDWCVQERYKGGVPTWVPYHLFKFTLENSLEIGLTLLLLLLVYLHIREADIIRQFVGGEL